MIKLPRGCKTAVSKAMGTKSNRVDILEIIWQDAYSYIAKARFIASKGFNGYNNSNQPIISYKVYRENDKTWTAYKII